MLLKQHDYDTFVEFYDVVEAGGSYLKLNKVLEKILKEHKIKTVLDMTCGTGAQTIYLTKKGYKIVGLDINKSMLARAEAKSKGLKIKYVLGDIRDSQLGKFDAVIAMFNAIGHLDKKDFDKALKNVSENLKSKGLFVFDIFNLDFMKNGGFIEHEFIDEASEVNGKKFVRFNKNVLDYDAGIIRVNQETFIQNSFDKPKIYRESWDMQIYSPAELKKLLEKNGFTVEFFNIEGKELKNDLAILAIAKKK